MQAALDVLYLTCPGVKLEEKDAPRLRGFLAGQNRGEASLHNHRQEGGFYYQYPFVQYKILSGVPTVVAWGDGIRAVIETAPELRTMQIGNETYPMSQDYLIRRLPIGDCGEPVQYRFATSWAALNEQNYARYLDMDDLERAELLRKTLAGNILSMAKGIGLTVENRLECRCWLRETTLQLKGREMVGFTGHFSVNYLIPDLFGLGKSTARGFGTVLKG